MCVPLRDAGELLAKITIEIDDNFHDETLRIAVTEPDSPIAA
jgi:hypothetical protein